MSLAIIVREKCETVAEVAESLKDLARAFLITGNRDVYDQLFLLGLQLDDSQEAIAEAVSEDITRQVAYAQEMSGTILKATLAGSQLAREEKGHPLVDDAEGRN